jgi:hypothetical protein
MKTPDLVKILSDQKEEFQRLSKRNLCARMEASQLSTESQLAQVVIGVRRSGKSTLCLKYFTDQKIVPAYVNFDDDRLASFKTADLDTLLEALYQLYGDFRYLFLDEIQNVEQWPLFVNRLLRQEIHIFLTGSNSKLLSGELATHLTGRHNKVELYPFSFSEYCTFRKVDSHSLSVKGQALRKAALMDYLTQGGFPELLNEKNRRGYIEGLLDNIIRNDITQRFRLRHVDVLYRMAAYLMDNFCQEFKADEVAKLFGITDHTAENYFHYLQEAFLLFSVRKFSFKSKNRIRNEKVYIVDPAFIAERNDTFQTENLGWRLENIVYIELLRRHRPNYADVFYFKEKDFECDFVVTQAGKVTELVQVAYDISNPKTRRRELNGLVKAANKLQCKSLTLVTLDNQEDVNLDGLNIHIVSASNWLIP